MNLLKMYSLLKMGIFHCYVSLPKGNFYIDFYLTPSLQRLDSLNKWYYCRRILELEMMSIPSSWIPKEHNDFVQS